MQHDPRGLHAAQVLARRAGAVSLSLALGLASLAAVQVPSRAQDVAGLGGSATASPAASQSSSSSQSTLRDMVRQRQGELEAASVTQLARSLPPSLTTALGLDARQVERLDRLYADFLLARVEQEGKIARWQDDLQRAQSPASFDEGKSRGLLGSIAGAQDKVRLAFLKARGQALRTLTPAQRAQVQALAERLRLDEQPELPSSGAGLDELPSVRVDEYRALLLMPVEKLLATPLDTQAARRVLAQRASNRYDRSGASRYNYSSGRSGRYGYGSSVFGGFGIGRGHGHGFGGIYGSFGHRDRFGGHQQHGGAHH